MINFRFLSELSPLVGITLAVLLGLVAWWFYRREVSDFPRPYCWLLPALRSGAIGLVVLMLLEPSLRFRSFEGTPTRLHVWVDATQSMSEEDRDSNQSQPAPSRYDRAVGALIEGDAPPLEQWTKKGEVVLGRFGGDQVSLLWQSTLAEPRDIPTQSEGLRPDAWLRPTSFRSLLQRQRERMGMRGKDEQADENSTAQQPAQNNPVLLFTDGQDNAGGEPLESLDKWPRDSAPIYIVGMGDPLPPQRVSVLGIDAPGQLYRSDRLSGSMRLQDGLLEGTTYEVSIYHEDEPLWRDSVRSLGPGEREVAFSFPLEGLVAKLEQSVPAGQQVQRLTIPLRAEVESSVGGAVSDSSSIYSWLIGVNTRKQRILLVDSRSRWETRYLRNALERDPQWEVDAYLLDGVTSPQWFSQVRSEVPFPEEEHQFGAYDLIVCGELEPAGISKQVQQHLRHAIQRGGAGLIVIDGQRGLWKEEAFRTLRPLLPIEWLAKREFGESTNWSIEPVTDSLQSGVLDLSAGSERNSEEVWGNLPQLKTLVAVKELPGSQVMATAREGDSRFPFLVTRMSGAGRVAYFAGDETWRWRYEVADQIHQRFWSQVSRWCMREPYAVESEYVALDSGQSVYALGQAIPIRARLRDTAGLPALLPQVQAVIRQGDRTVTTSLLTMEASVPGTYRGQVFGLAPGDYSVSLQLAGFSAEAVNVSTMLRVLESENREMRDVSRHDSLLMQIANLSGGMYVPEDRVHEIWEAMELRYTGQFIESDTLLWQSFWWFVPLMSMIALEWWLRKKAGLI